MHRGLFSHDFIMTIHRTADRTDRRPYLYDTAVFFAFIAAIPVMMESRGVFLSSPTEAREEDKSHSAA